MNKPEFQKTMVNRVLDIIESEVYYDFKMFRAGDPVYFPLSSLPAILATETDTRWASGPTGHDEVEHDIRIQVVFNKKDEYGNPDVSATLENKMEAITQGIDADTGALHPNTIVGILRRNLTLKPLSTGTNVTVQKGVIPRSEELVTAETHIQVTIQELIEVKNRV